MKQVVVVKPVPDAATRAAPAETLALCNAEANRVAGVAFAHRDTETGKVEREYALRGRVYAEAKSTGIGSQSAQHVVKNVRDAYAVVYAQIRSGMLRGKGAANALAKPVIFRSGAAQPFDDRCLSWDLKARTISIRTTHGRRRGVAFACSRRDLEMLRLAAKGESEESRRPRRRN